MGALQKDPRKNQQQKQPAKKAPGAMGKDPRFVVGSDAATLDAQEASLKKRLEKNPNAKVANQRMQQINAARGALGTDPGQAQQPAAGQPDPTQVQAAVQPQGQQQPAPMYEGQQQQMQTNMQGFDQSTGAANSYLNQTFGQLQQQGPFNPGDFNASRQKASDYAMSEFNRQNQARFAQEDQQFAQQMADQGIDENSEKYRYLKGQNDLSRQNAIQGAQNNAFQMGQSEQAQAYGQAANTYQMPLNQLNAASPFYGYQNQNMQQQNSQMFQAGQNDLNRMQQANMQNAGQAWQAGQNQQQQTFEQGMQQSGFGGQSDLAAQQFKYNKYLQEHQKSGGGGGGLTYEQQLALQNNALDKDFYNKMVINGMQQGGGPPLPGVGSGFSNGVSNGIVTGAVMGMRR